MWSCVNIEYVRVSVMISLDSFGLVVAVAMLAALTVADHADDVAIETVMSYATHVLATAS
jgi:hypothetical protein